MTLAEYLALKRQKPTQFAREIGVSVSTITRLINRERRPNKDTLSKIRGATNGNVSANDFWEDQKVGA